MVGILCYCEGKATDAERHLLYAETIISDIMGKVKSAIPILSIVS